MIYFLFILFTLTLAKHCKETGCPEGKCCSYWGYCGETDEFCGAGMTQCVCDCKGMNPCIPNTGSAMTKPTTPNCVHYKATANLNLYKGPSSIFGKVKTIPAGSVVCVVSNSGNWAKLSDGTFAYNAFLNKVESDDLATRISEILEELIGSPAKEYGAGTGTQCVELPKYYMNQLYGLEVKNKPLGNGKDMWNVIPSCYPSYFKQYTWNSTFQVLPGDIVSLSSRDYPQYGHAAIAYTGGIGANFTMLEQWKDSETVRLNTDPLYYKKIFGVARPYKEL